MLVLSEQECGCGSSSQQPENTCVDVETEVAGCLPSDRASVSLTRLLMPSSSDVVAVRTVPPSVSRNSFSSCSGKKVMTHQKYQDHATIKH